VISLAIAHWGKNEKGENEGVSWLQIEVLPGVSGSVSIVQFCLILILIPQVAQIACASGVSHPEHDPVLGYTPDSRTVTNKGYMSAHTPCMFA